MKKLFIICCFVIIGNISFSQCLPPTNTNVTNISMYVATANWTTVSSAHHYRIRYKEIGLSNWTNFNNIHFLQTSRNLPNLQPSALYVWQIMTYCDSLGSITSSWSSPDTFATLTPQCPTPTGLFVTNITHNAAMANWIPVLGVDHYRVRLRELGQVNWGNLLNIDSTMTSRILPLLIPLTTYEWKIEAYCDSSNQSNSAWSVIDTFTTDSFIPSPFNPQLFFGMSSTLCNTAVSFSLRVTQSFAEPDILSSEILSDGGSFNINSVSSGDTVGAAEVIRTDPFWLTTDTIIATLTVGFTLGNNIATIFSVDTSGIVGMFSIENLSGGGVKVSSTAPTGGNNQYTSGDNSSLLILNSLFVTPANPGPLTFTAHIESKLNDQLYLVDSSTTIFCNTGLEEAPSKRRLLKIVNLFGNRSVETQNTLLFYIYDDGFVEKKINFE